MADVLLKPSTITLDELLQLGSDARIEIINGEIVEMSPVGIEHAIIADNVYRVLFQFVTKNNLGYVFSADLIYVLKEDKAEKLRDTCVPDTSFVRRGRFPKEFNIKKPFPGAPDLAVEVMSPDDKAEDMEAKIGAYFEAGTDQVWVLYPKRASLHQHRRVDLKIVRVYQGSDVIDAESLFPDLQLAAQDLFAMPDFGN